MMKRISLNFLPLLVLFSVFGRGQVVVTVKNELDVVRPSETIEVSGPELLRLLPTNDSKRFHVAEVGGGEVLVQAVDLTGDGVLEQLIFQADFKPLEAKKFAITLGPPQHLTNEQFKAYGRFVRERFDDFAWENDRVAHRMYGPALETWQNEPLTSSTVDIWCKRVRKLVINDWYMVDNYHADTGEGADFYSAGKSRGCGGSGIWEGGKLYTARNFMGSRVLANGPIRVVFELDYGAWVANGRRIAETKRISLDAGQNLSRFESHYLMAGQSDLTIAAGIKRNPGSTVKVEKGQGWLRTWEPIKDNGNVGCGIIADPASVVDSTEDDLNYLLVIRGPGGMPFSYYAGFGWDKSGDFSGVEAWEAYLSQFAARLKSPVKMTIEGK
ncbi:MAG: DUF4861 domain-containing protein [Acidobacteria bacterium]|nr:MAG: DUF4861 domain-containing protein [Acidobacteriota bacterium]